MTPSQEAALREVLDYFAEREDVVDGDYGQPLPNEAMQLANLVRFVLGERPAP